MGDPDIFRRNLAKAALTTFGALLLLLLTASDHSVSGDRLSAEALSAPHLQLAQDQADDAGSAEDETVGEDAEISEDGAQSSREAALPRSDDLPDIITDLDTLPFPVRKMRSLILEAAYSGDIEKLRPYIGYGDDVTMLSLGGVEQDPIEFLKSISGDPEGHEILAIMSEILEAPAVRFEYQPEQFVYVWPYFYGYPFEKLTPQQRVSLFRIITYGDYEEMVAFGNYIFYRLGITPEGRWRFFVAGD